MSAAIWAKAALPSWSGRLGALRADISVELELLTALLETLDDAARKKMMEHLFQGVLAGRRTAYQAMALIRGTKLTYGQQKDLDAAFAFIAREGVGQ